MLKQFPNEGGVGPEWTTLDVETGPGNMAVFTLRLGVGGLNALQEAIDTLEPGDESTNVVLQAPSVAKLIALLQSSQPEAVDVATPLIDGTETGAKRYALWLTHDEIHLLHWALKSAESIAQRDPMFISNGMTYAELRADTVDDEMFDAFVTKFNNVHRQARIDDGEQVGLTSAPDAPITPTPEA